MFGYNYNVLFCDDISSLVGEDTVVVTKEHELYDFIHTAIEGFTNGLLTYGLLRISELEAVVAFLYEISGDSEVGTLLFRYGITDMSVNYDFTR